MAAWRRVMRRLTADDVRAGLWTLRALGAYRRQHERRRVEDIAFPPSGRIGVSGSRAVGAILRRRTDQCLSSALVAQAWRADHGDYVDVVIGVTSPTRGFTAHAWLSDAPAASAGHEPISRIAPRQVRARR
jgi:hypothetical protein